MTVNLKPESVLYFRARRHHLAGKPAPDAVAAARSILGVQAQVESWGLQALSLRTQGRPTAEQSTRTLLEERSLVRTWGQRDTLHIYALEDWPLVIAARELWVRSGRRGGMPPDKAVEAARRVFEEAGRPLARSDLFEVIPQSFIDELKDHPGSQGSGGAQRFAATRLIWVLAMHGHIAFASKVGRELTYVHRSQLWKKAWPQLDAEQASTAATRRYLSAFGAATPQDVAHHLGARVSDARRWLQALESELVPCRCDGHGELVALKQDLDELQAKPGDWPLRLLPAYDTMLMGHRDKRWLLPDASLEPKVWKKAAVVAATVLVRGRIVGTWSMKKKGKRLELTVDPLPDWDSAHVGQLEIEAQAVADHLKLQLNDLKHP